ncbi:MAG TPA: methyltransferase domain-containing protein [Pyrinomonadaceae bacterium]|nr:methyltransferase domain-containing protein [Pyrinomonadaceae bacterium]
MSTEFRDFEHQGWQRIAHKYEKTWSRLTKAFIPALLSAVNIRNGVRVLDVACGPGYVAHAARAAGAIPIGLDFSAEMIRLARKQNPTIEFQEGDAHALPFADGTFDIVTINFGLLHLADPEKALAESYRVLCAGGRVGFNVWAPPAVSPGARIVDSALKEYANLDVELPKGPDYFGFNQKRVCRNVLARLGFDPASTSFETMTTEWLVPSPTFVFEAEKNAGVRTAALLAQQTPAALERISKRIAESVTRYAKGSGYAIPYAAHIVSARK